MSKYNHDDPGYIYIMSNESMPGVVKVGVTTKCVIGRAGQLHTTGVPTPFKVEFAMFVEGCHEMELWCHDKLDQWRIEGREFFRIDVEQAVQEVANTIFANTGLQANEVIDAELAPAEDFYPLLAYNLTQMGVGYNDGHAFHQYDMAQIVEGIKAEELIPAVDRWKERRARMKKRRADQKHQKQIQEKVKLKAV